MNSEFTVDSNTLRAVLNSLSKSIILIDTKGCIVWHNSSFEMMTAIHTESCALEKYNTEDGHRLSIFSLFQEIFPPGPEGIDVLTDIHEKNSFFDPNGFSATLRASKNRTYNIKALPMLDSNDNIENIIITIFDLTEQLEFEMEYQRQHLISDGINRVSAAGLVVTEANSGNIIRSNPAAQKIFNLSEQDLAGRNIHTLLHFENELKEVNDENKSLLQAKRGFAVRPEKNLLRIKYSSRTVRIQETKFQIHSILDINDVYMLLQKQQMDIKAAMTSQALLNSDSAEAVDIRPDIRLTASGFFKPCHLAGGDDNWFMHFKKHKKSLFVIRDHSGHDVACLIRAITTDIFNKKLIDLKGPDLKALSSNLNNGLVKCGFLEAGQFVTGMDLLLDHETLKLEYISYGHPSVMHIGDEKISFFPDNDSNARGIPLGFLPDFEYSVQTVQLNPGDMIISFTDGLTEFLKHDVVTRISEDEIKTHLESYMKKFRCKKSDSKSDSKSNTIFDTSADLYRKPHIKDIQRELTVYALKTAGLDYSRNTKTSYPDDITVAGFELENLEDSHGLEWKWKIDRKNKNRVIDEALHLLIKSNAIDLLVTPEKNYEKIKNSIAKILSRALENNEISTDSSPVEKNEFTGLSIDFKNNLVIKLSKKCSPGEKNFRDSNQYEKPSKDGKKYGFSDCYDYDHSFLRALESNLGTKTLTDEIYLEADYFYFSTGDGLVF